MLKRSCKCGKLHLRGTPCPLVSMRKNTRRSNPTYATTAYRHSRKLLIDNTWKNRLPCHICGRPFTQRADITADHIVPVARGGSNDISNLSPAHLSCNSRRGGQKVQRPFL
jgi:5-methylcytosine-specific restriction endonuclease McrA